MPGHTGVRTIEAEKAQVNVRTFIRLSSIAEMRRSPESGNPAAVVGAIAAEEFAVGTLPVAAIASAFARERCQSQVEWTAQCGDRLQVVRGSNPPSPP